MTVCDSNWYLAINVYHQLLVQVYAQLGLETNPRTSYTLVLDLFLTTGII